MSRKLNAHKILFLLFLTAGPLCLPLEANAQTETAYDLINAVNALRASYGLDPYQIEPDLMAYAQEHTDYQAAIMTSTHIHSDGLKPHEVGLKENVAMGDVGFVTVSVVVHNIWVDWGHLKTMIGYETGEIGAGVALSEDGKVVFYTIDVRPGVEVSTATIGPETTAVTTGPIQSLVTSTPDGNGSIFHPVGYGQTLWSIAEAYGVTVDDIRRLNGIASDSTIIYAGQVLLIRGDAGSIDVPQTEESSVFTQTVVDTITLVAETMPPTGTASPAPSSSLTLSSTPTDNAQGDGDFSLEVVLIICAVGLLIGFLYTLRKLRVGQG